MFYGVVYFWLWLIVFKVFGVPMALAYIVLVFWCPAGGYEELFHLVKGVEECSGWLSLWLTSCLVF